MVHTLTNTYVISQLTQVSQTADALSLEVTEARKGKTSLKLALDGIESSVSTVDGEVSTLQQTVGEISTSVTNTQGDVSTLQQRADGFDTSIADANGNISTLQQSVNDINVSITGISGDVTNLQQTDTALSASIKDNADNITNLTATVDGVSTTVGNLSANQTTMSQDAESLKVVVAKMGGNVETNTVVNTIMKIDENGLAVSGESSSGLVTNKTVIDKDSLKGYYNPLGVGDTLNDEDIVFQIDEDIVKTKRLYAEKGCDFYTIKAVPVTLSSPSTNGLIFIKSLK